MISGKKLIIVILSLIIINIIPGKSEARSVYVISDTGTDQYDTPIMQVYNIEDSNLILQKQYECVYPLAISLAIDPEYEFMFITHEKYYGVAGDMIEIVNAKTMQYVDTVTAPGADNLAGIAMDTDSEVSFDKISFSGIIRYNKVGAFRKISNTI